MHWIAVGILIWVGLAIAPVIIELIVFLIPGAFFGFIAALAGLLITGNFVVFFWCGVIGAIAPYFFMNDQN